MYANDASEKEDLFQEILLNAWKGVKNYRGDAKFTTWLYRVALNTAITAHRKSVKRPLINSVASFIEDIPAADPVTDERVKVMYTAINQLDRIDKAIVLLHLDSYSHRDIAGIMGISVNNVAVKLNRIKTKLKETTLKISTI